MRDKTLRYSRILVIRKGFKYSLRRVDIYQEHSFNEGNYEVVISLTDSEIFRGTKTTEDVELFANKIFQSYFKNKKVSSLNWKVGERGFVEDFMMQSDLPLKLYNERYYLPETLLKNGVYSKCNI